MRHVFLERLEIHERQSERVNVNTLDRKTCVPEKERERNKEREKQRVREIERNKESEKETESETERQRQRKRKRDRARGDSDIESESRFTCPLPTNGRERFLRVISAGLRVNFHKD